MNLDVKREEEESLINDRHVLKVNKNTVILVTFVRKGYKRFFKLFMRLWIILRLEIYFIL
jgi:hypothetical protein